MRLINELGVDGYFYEFFINEDGKKYIKIFFVDDYGGVVYLGISEDEVKDVKKMINTAISYFKDKKIWQE